MDEYHCCAYPHISASDFVSETPFCPDDQRFSVEVAYTNMYMYVLNAREFETSENTTHHRFSNISKDEIMQETTIVSWLSSMGVPSEAHRSVVAKVLQCARGMANDRIPIKVLSMRVDVTITQPGDDFHEDDEEYEDDDEDDDDEDHGLVPNAAKSQYVDGWETVEQEGCKKCAICLEDFNVGVRMPCLHMFHENCIGEWLQIGNSCPLCRFKMPPQMG